MTVYIYSKILQKKSIRLHSPQIYLEQPNPNPNIFGWTLLACHGSIISMNNYFDLKSRFDKRSK